MQAFEDKAAEVAERSTERMHFRTKPHIKRTIQHAAALAGVDDSAFTINAAYKAALETIEAHEHTVLSYEDFQHILDALENPPPPTDALREAFTRYRERYLDN